MIKTLTSAGFSYLFKFIGFIVLGLIINGVLAMVYFDNISGLFQNNNILLGSITIVTVILFPMLWLLFGKTEAVSSAIFKVMNGHLEDLVEFVIKNFLTEGSRDKVGDYGSKLEGQSTVTRFILEFLFEKINFFEEISKLLKEKDYSDEELTLKMCEKIREEEFFEDLEPSLLTPFLLMVVNIGVLYVANYFL
ncbi:MAG: Unknown protein [uncultured Sulfurovum sp.]|uniref:Type II secretion system protein GspF domain-containing protein n=1 Tax=uncultured Sulfurovum sp. TaxID=269237 RepID=A0A6S6T9P5_9BACT|nr:MAG: Unknown protein [uncultured Sulfurovum sp.]